jgi:hypothetical protein
MVDKAEAVGNFAVSDMLECTENNKDRFGAVGMYGAKTSPRGIPLRATILGDARGLFFVASIPCPSHVRLDASPRIATRAG